MCKTSLTINKIFKFCSGIRGHTMIIRKVNTKEKLDMPRRPRLSMESVPLHILQRGIKRNACFFRKEDYYFYLGLLREQSLKQHCAVHAYVLMPNHIHLLLTPHRKNSASLLMKYIGQFYTQYINKTYRRCGTLWEGRFRSCMLEDKDYVLLCSRYIELNPVRTGIVACPEDYYWSSYHANGEGKNNLLLTKHESYWQLGTSLKECEENYRKKIAEQITPDVLKQIRFSINGNYALGGQEFKDGLEKMLHCRVTPGKAGRPKKLKHNNSVV